jgi:Putative peptidoglycan binding domain
VVVTPPPASGGRGVARNTAVGPWQALNDGLAITQPNYLAQTPVSDSLMLAGTQDNGTEQRLGPAAWKVIQEGDGGGCAIDPGHPNRRFVQYTGFTWYTETDPTRYYVQTLNYSSAGPALKTAWQAEDHDSAFYSHAAARVLGSGVTALVFGSYRLWYCEDWGQHWIPKAPAPDSWQTLPTGSNPLEAKDAAGQPAPNMNQDSLASQVIRVAFIDDNRLLVLTQAGFSKPNPRPAALYLFTRSGPPWTVAWLSPPDPGQPAPAAPPAGAQNGFPAGEIPVGLAVDTPGPPATCYVTLGIGQDRKHPGIDHVWWYDGTHWWPCRFDATVADTPVNAAVVDVDRTVYVGTDVGVWKGVPNTAATPPTWAWSQFSDGLPEVPVVDLVIGPSPHLLRAATHGRGVWELNLDETGPVNQTYLRAHSADTRRLTFPAGGNDPNTPTDPPPLARIDASPDIIITGPANPAAPADLPLFRQPRPKYSDSTRVLQYALRRRQLAAAVPPPIAATVIVDGYFGTRTKNAVIAVQAATPGLTADGVVNTASWQAIVTAPYVDALAGADADCLDMALLDRISPVAGPAGGPSLASLPSNAEVYVQVNARGWPRRPPGTVHVGLLATPAFDATLAGLPALPGDWVTQFQAAVTTAPGTWVTGGAPWAWIGSPATMATTRPLHPEEPQVVRFVVTFPLPSGAPSMPANWTLLAFADDPLDPLSSTVTSVLGLITNDRHAAVRSVTLAIP